MRFFVVSAGQPGEEYMDQNFERIIKNNAFNLHEDTMKKGAYHEIQANDVLILKYNDSLVAYGVATTRYKTENEPFNLWAGVVEWVLHNYEIPKQGISKTGIGKAAINAGSFDTVKAVNSDYAVKKITLINPNHKAYKFILENYNKSFQEMKMQEIINVLEHKKQIILQGPPGTGKTYTADAIAKQLTEVETVSNPKELIDEFYKNFKAKDPKVITERQERQDLRERFLTNFPKESVKHLSLEEYCIGTGERDNFCWWIERGLQPLGYYFPGSSRSYRIYWSKSNDEYSKNGSLKAIEDDEEAMKVVAGYLDKIVTQEDYKSAIQFFGPSFILKLLNTYYPEKYAPINAVNYIKNALALVGLEDENSDFVELNQLLLGLHRKKNEEFKTDVKPYEFMRFLVENFNLKKGEKLQANNVITKGDYELIQFHPAYSYEDFVRGIDAEVVDKQPTFSVKNKILAEFAERATDNPKANFVLIIDEINRANLPAVLGELIYALEYRGQPVNSLYEFEGERAINLPNNLFIIGTMNTADRSVGHIDYAIRRRFSFIDVLPNEMHVPDFAKDKFQIVSNLFSEDNLLASDFRKEDVQIGHSYFMAKTKEELDIKIKYEVVPILKEYLKDGVLNKEAEKVIEALASE
jgi:5-methylcytosine-specific restriction protein B